MNGYVESHLTISKGRFIESMKVSKIKDVTENPKTKVEKKSLYITYNDEMPN